MLLTLDMVLISMVLALTVLMVMHIEQAILLWQGVVVLLLAAFICRVSVAKIIHNPNTQAQLDIYQGTIDIHQQCYQILGSSKIAFYGYYLKLAAANHDNNSKADTMRLLIDKRSLTDYQCACLSYAILKQQTHYH